MKTFRFLFYTFCCLLFPSLASLAQAREDIRLNRDYKFQLGDVTGAQKAQFNDANWAPVSLPHSFSTPYWGDTQFHVGSGWYRKNLPIKPEWLNKKVFLDFEGVFQECDVYLNGEFIGQHQGGYTGFRMDLTPALKKGNNKLAIRVNNLWNPELAPRAGEHVFSGGIYRDVNLVVTDPVHITWFGTFVKTPQVSKESATVEMTTEIKNEEKTTVEGKLVSTLLDPKGQKVSEVSTPFSLAAGGVQEIAQSFPTVTNPALWHPDTPQLYTVKSQVFRGDKEVDSYETPFGIRWFEFTKDKGFFLNGEKFYIRGANVHQDRAGWGDAVVNSAFDRDVKMIKDSGLNFIRGSHYPHDPAFTEACDKRGILYWSEGVFWGIGGFKPDGYWDSSAMPPDKKHHKAFEESLRNALRDMIRVHRNHPSVVTWSMGNEIFFSDKAVMQDAKDCLKRLIEYSKELDPTRPASVGGVQREGFDTIGDIAGYNGDGAFVTNPTLPSLVAEYGSEVSHRPGQYARFRGCLQEKPLDWRSGEVLWCGFHHGSIAGSMGRMGFIDYARLPLRTWYWYRNDILKQAPPEWPSEGTPNALTLTSDKTELRRTDGTEDAHLIVSIVDAQGKRLSNTAPVTLTIESGPGIFPTGKSLTFEPDADNKPAIRDGQAAVEFRSYFAGKTVIKATSPGLKEATLTLTSLNGPKFIPNKSKEWMPVAAPAEKKNTSAPAVECSLARPSTSSALAEGSEGKFANDGDTNTVWKSLTNDKGISWWRLDLENFYALNQIELAGIKADDFVAEITADEGKTWTTIGKKADAQEKDGRFILICDPLKDYGRFLRISYKAAPKTIVEQADISVKGKSR